MSQSQLGPSWAWLDNQRPCQHSSLPCPAPHQPQPRDAVATLCLPRAWPSQPCCAAVPGTSSLACMQPACSRGVRRGGTAARAVTPTDCLSSYSSLHRTVLGCQRAGAHTLGWALLTPRAATDDSSQLSSAQGCPAQQPDSTGQERRLPGIGNSFLAVGAARVLYMLLNPELGVARPRPGWAQHLTGMQCCCY